ncbi:MAG: glycoside hydrolase family 13 protein [Lachnospiraceae bacterium]|nr:glycoside hydrolase family 13 protein [Lachnospiraceae bacterium]
MNTEAIFSDGSPMFVSPWQPQSFDMVQIGIRVSSKDNCIPELMTQTGTFPMRKEKVCGEFVYYKTTICLNGENLEYCFRISCGDETVYYDRVGVTKEIRSQYYFKIVPDFYVPNWMVGAVIYQIMVDRFYSGSDDNDVLTNEYSYVGHFVQRIEDWYEYPKNLDIGNFYGGDLEGVRQKFNYLKSLGVEVIYFNPIFVSPSNHKYDTQDYEHIDPHITVIKEDGGEVLKDNDYDNTHATKFQKRVCDIDNLEASNQFFADFVREAHEAGLKIIIDGVFNHCGSFNKWLDREKIYQNKKGFEDGAYISKDSPYNKYFHFYDEKAWPYNGSYDGWWGYDTLPKLNYENSKALQQKILDIGKKWVSEPYNVDGWRLDVAADLGHSEEFNHTFWKEFRKAVRSVNPEAVIFAEHYGDPKAWLQGDEWDTIMNYDAFMEPVTFFLTGMEKHSDEFHKDALGNGYQFEETMRYRMTELLPQSLYSSMNQLSNHDHSRFLTRTNHVVGRVADLGSKAAEEGVNPAVLRQAVVMLMTWPGAPTLYYGDEAGLCGFTDPDNRRTYPWGREDSNLIDFHRDMTFIHKKNDVLKMGSLIFLKSQNNLVSYARIFENEAMVVIVNTAGNNMECNIPVWKAGVPMRSVMKRIIMTNERGYSIMPKNSDVIHGYLNIDLSANSAVVYRWYQENN